ncbi:MAG: BTB domain domain-containing protein [bacterium]
MPNPNLLIIHVYDENRQMTRDFKCHRKLLLDNMKYFESYLKDTENNEDIDI